MKKRYLVFILALSAALILSSCAIVGGSAGLSQTTAAGKQAQSGAAAQTQSRFVKLKTTNGGETVLNLDLIEKIVYVPKTEILQETAPEHWDVYFVPADNSRADFTVTTRENAAILYAAMGLTLD
ncbi:MAG: hypothetical protein II192_01915 [Clostridia bacterium]|nr:hypothetical protein [Clostridia bacterium]